jgi:hypothetical protein
MIRRGTLLKTCTDRKHVPDWFIDSNSGEQEKSIEWCVLKVE